jgi:flagellar basal body-associated protein FliL
MNRQGWWIILVICVILLCVTTWCYFRYTYHERDESYVNLNGIYIKCEPIDTNYLNQSVNCYLPDGRTIQVIKSVNFNSTLK